MKRFFQLLSIVLIARNSTNDLDRQGIIKPGDKSAK
jgi:hypothetical protein